MTRCEIAQVEPVPMGGAHGPSGWRFAVYSDVVGDHAPYRAFLARLAAYGQTSLSLPDPEKGEDCVEGFLIWGDQRVDFSFECQVLSYLEFSCLNREALEAVRLVLSKQLP